VHFIALYNSSPNLSVIYNVFQIFCPACVEHCRRVAWQQAWRPINCAAFVTFSQETLRIYQGIENCCNWLGFGKCSTKVLMWILWLLKLLHVTCCGHSYLAAGHQYECSNFCCPNSTSLPVGWSMLIVKQYEVHAASSWVGFTHFPFQLSYLSNTSKNNLPTTYTFLLFRDVMRSDVARVKKQVWRPHVQTWALSEANLLYWRKYLWQCLDFSVPP